MGATLGAAFGVLVHTVHPMETFGTTTCAVIGMAAMVGGGTGAAMTAVTMIFEMTRDYDLVMPSIIAVALAIGVRRLLSIENIYTIKLVGRGHFVPKALYANMFLVRRARDVMQKDITLLAADAHFDAFLRQHGEEHGLRYVVVTRGHHIAGVVRVNTSLRRGIGLLQRHPSRRRGAGEFHHRPRERHHVRRRAADNAARRRHGYRDQGPKPGSPR
jgi:CIC family chloride channel protein